MNPWIAKSVILVASVVMVVIRHLTGAGVAESRSRGASKVHARSPADAGVGGVPVPLSGSCPLYSRSPSIRFIPGRSAPESCASQGASGGFIIHTPTWARTGRSPSNYARTIDSSRKASIAMSVIQCTPHSSFTPLARRSASNWVAGPSYWVAFGILFGLRIGAEENHARAFGDKYAAYMARTKLLIPGIW